MSRAAPPDLPPAASPLPSRTPGALGPRSGKSGPAAPAGLAAGASAGGVALGRREGRAQVTALVLSLRRRAEADVQEQLRRVKTHLELARRSEAQAQRQVEQAKQKLQALTGALTKGFLAQPAPGPAAAPLTATSAEWLASQAARILRQRQLVHQRHHELDLQTEQVHALVRQQSELHEALRLALALREAAELHESAELREQRRTRAQRQRALEEEARDRFLSAQRQSRSHR